MRNFLLSFFLLCSSSSLISMQLVHDMIPRYDLLLPEFEQLFQESTSIPEKFDIFKPYIYESMLSLQSNKKTYHECLAKYTKQLVDEFSDMYMAVFEGLAFIEFVDLMNNATAAEPNNTTTDDLMQSRYEHIANKKHFSRMLLKKCKRFKTFNETYEFMLKILEVPVLITLLSLEIEFDRDNIYYNYTPDAAICSYCFHEPIKLNLIGYQLIPAVSKNAADGEALRKKLSLALTEYLKTGISPNMPQSLYDLHEAMRILKKYFQFKPGVTFAGHDISFDDLSSYIAFHCVTKNNFTDLVFFYIYIPKKYKKSLVTLAIKWFIYHILQKKYSTTIKDESLYFFTTDRREFMSNVHSRLLYHLSLDEALSLNGLVALENTIDQLVDNPKHVPIIAKLLKLEGHDVTELQKILNLHLQ